MEKFIRENIERINSGINSFQNERPNKLEIQSYLRQKFMSELPARKEELISRLQEENYIRARIEVIANEFFYYKGDLERFYNVYIYHVLLENISVNDLLNAVEGSVKSQVGNDNAFRFIRKDFRRLGEKLLILLKRGGFQSNLMGLNEGVMVANSGDSAQFLFLSRAILAGFNCSNVDVRSSRYDAIIDFSGILLKVQVKGVSNNIISFKDRDRGGQGIDHNHERNRGRIITSEDCDIYAAVDKQCGLVYIIPMHEIDKLPDENKIRVNVNDLSQYLENWDIIRDASERIKNL